MEGTRCGGRISSSIVKLERRKKCLLNRGGKKRGKGFSSMNERIRGARRQSGLVRVQRRKDEKEKAACRWGKKNREAART